MTNREVLLGLLRHAPYALKLQVVPVPNAEAGTGHRLQIIFDADGGDVQADGQLVDALKTLNGETL